MILILYSWNESCYSRMALGVEQRVAERIMLTPGGYIGFDTLFKWALMVAWISGPPSAPRMMACEGSRVVRRRRRRTRRTSFIAQNIEKIVPYGFRLHGRLRSLSRCRSRSSPTSTRIRILDIWSLRERLRPVSVSHLPWGLRSSGLVGPCPRLSRGHREPKERHRSSPISPRNCMIRILFFPIVSILPILQR